jgi:hypothetical protein
MCLVMNDDKTNALNSSTSSSNEQEAYESSSFVMYFPMYRVMHAPTRLALQNLPMRLDVSELSTLLRKESLLHLLHELEFSQRHVLVHGGLDQISRPSFFSASSTSTAAALAVTLSSVTACSLPTSL